MSYEAYIESADGSYTLLSDLIRVTPPVPVSAAVAAVGGESKGPVVTVAAAIPPVAGDVAGAAVGYSVFSATDFLPITTTSTVPSSTATPAVIAVADVTAATTTTGSSYDSYLLSSDGPALASHIAAANHAIATASTTVTPSSSIPVVNWQARFEEALMMPANDVTQKLDKARALRDVTIEFSTAARALGRVIIEESSLPEAQRTFKPLTGKGIAGGEKYCAGGIFVKLTRDFAGIYGGDMGAAKAAKHEIRSLRELISCNIPKLFFPMLCIVDYLGLRLVCTSLIDGIGSSTLVYGSQDAGRTVHCSDPIMNWKVREACTMKNLKGHNVIPRSGRGQLLFGPADLEGHSIKREGVEDKHYMLDFARLLPPEAPSRTPKGTSTDGILISADEKVEQEYFTATNCNEYIMEHLGFIAPTPIPVAIPVVALPSSLADATPAAVATPSDTAAAVAPVVVPIAAPVTPAPVVVAAVVDEEPKKTLDLRMYPRSEGVIAFNAAATHLPINHRASMIAECEVHGTAILWQDTGKIFFCLTRSELVATSKEPLSSDAFSGFGACKKCTSVSPHDCCPHDAGVNHESVEKATSRLFSDVIPKFAADLDSRAISPSDSVALVRELHKVGINVRWMGTLRRHVKLAYISRFLLTEMITRTVRHMLTADLRAAHKAAVLSMQAAAVANAATAAAAAVAPVVASDAHVPSEYTTVSETGLATVAPSSSGAPVATYTKYTTPTGYELPALSSSATGDAKTSTPMSIALLADPMAPYKLATLALFNMVFGTSATANSFWTNKLKKLLTRKFHGSLDKDELTETFDLRKQVLKFPLFTRLQEITGVIFNKSVIQRLFDEPARFDVPEPFTVTDLDGMEAKFKTIDFDDDINKYIYELAIADSADKKDDINDGKRDVAATSSIAPPPPVAAGTGEEQGTWKSLLAGAVPQRLKLKEMDLMAGYHMRAHVLLGARHPNVVTSCFKLALDYSRKGNFEAALEIALEGLLRSEATFGTYSPNYIVGMISLGEIHMRKHNIEEAINYFSKALLFTERIHGHHPLIGKLSTYLGRLQLMTDNKRAGIKAMSRGYKVYEEFYGKAVAEYLAPCITMGKGEEIAVALGQLAHTIKPLVPEVKVATIEGDNKRVEGKDEKSIGVAGAAAAAAAEADDTTELYQRLLTAIRIIEDMEGLSRGYYHGKSLELAVAPSLRRVASGEARALLTEAQLMEVVSFDDGNANGTGLKWATAGVITSFQVRSQTIPTITISSPRGADLIPFVASSQPGIYQVSYLAVAGGAHNVQVKYTNPSGTPIDIQTVLTVLPGRAWAKRSFAHGAHVDAKAGMNDQPFKFSVTMVDPYGNVITQRPWPHQAHGYPLQGLSGNLAMVGGMFGQNIEPHTFEWDAKNSVFNSSFILGMPGKYNFGIRQFSSKQLGSSNLRGMPMVITISAPTGKAFCDNMVPNQGGERIVYCVACGRRDATKCVRCKSALIPSAGQFNPRQCMTCGIKNKDKCRGCGIRVMIQAVPAMLCRGCGVPPLVNKCCATK